MTMVGTAGTRAAPRALRTQVVDGRRPVLAQLPRLERLARRLEVPVTARTAWTRGQLDAEPGSQPWAVRVTGADGELLAAAVILDGCSATARLAGGGGGYRGAVIAADEDAAAALGRGVAAEIERRGQVGAPSLLPDDTLTAAFAAAAYADLVPAGPIPALVPDRGADLALYLSHGTLRTLRKARNRLGVDDRTADVVVSRRAEDVMAALPALARIYRARDEQHHVSSELDSAAGLAAWRARMRRLLENRCLELATLTVDSELAAYVVGLPDGHWYRILDGRMDAAFSRYAPGRLLEAAILDRALARGYAGVDWMTAVAPETLLAATAVQPTVTLTWQGPADAA